MNVISIIFGLLAAPFAIIGNIPIPLFGLVNWLALPLAITGAILGLFSDKRTGFTLNLVVLALAAFRLIVCGGVL